ncbi:PPOX class F420-dependent oxidoreductase [Gordonia aurantiaca]|uniref:PPOX class F420-dependent oxidoreductase n=1 Tax=Gordonia sp. B21 TaxID=3151852 RepID=UPI00326520FB
MARTVARADTVDRAGLVEFIRPRHQMILSTVRSDGRPQMSPVTGGVDDEGRIVISTYPARAKATNVRRTPVANVVVLSDEFNGAWVQVDGDAEVLDMPEAEDALVDYYRSIAGEHPDWDEYRAAMRLQGKSLIRITPTHWGPIATGGFPADVAAKLDAQDG